MLFDDQHNSAEAIKYYRESLRIRETALPPGDNDKLATIDNLVRLYRDAHNNTDAEALDREAFEDVKKLKGEESKEAANRLDTLSFFLVEEGKYDEALKHFERTLEIRKKILEPKDPDIATSTSNIAYVYFKKADYPPAIEKETVAIRIYEDDLGEKAPVLADHFTFLATLYYRSGKYADAIVYQDRVISSVRNAKTPDTRTIGVATNNLGLFLKADGKYDEAIAKFKASIELLVKAGDRANEATARHNLGNTYEAKGDFPAAQDCYRQAVIIEQELHDKTNEADTLLDLAGVLARQRQSGPALDTYRSALAIEKELDDRGMQAYALNGIGDLYKSADQYDQATETYLQAINIREDVFPNSNGLAETFANLADVYKAQGKVCRCGRRLSVACSKFARKMTAKTARPPFWPSTISPRCSIPKENSPKPSLCSSRPSPSRKNSSVPTMRVSPLRSQIFPAFTLIKVNTRKPSRSIAGL